MTNLVFGCFLPPERRAPTSLSARTKKEKWSMIPQTGSDKLDVAHSILGIRDPLRWMSLSTNRKTARGLEGKWWKRCERDDVKCLSNQSWIGIWLQHWWLSLWSCSYWAASPVNPSRTVCLQAFFILSDYSDWVYVDVTFRIDTVHLWGLNKHVCMRVFAGFCLLCFYFLFFCSPPALLCSFHPLTIWYLCLIKMRIFEALRKYSKQHIAKLTSNPKI